MHGLPIPSGTVLIGLGQGGAGIPRRSAARKPAVLAQAATPGEEVVALLQREPLAELQALLDQLEP